MCNVGYILSRMDFPSTLRPSLFKAGPLGLTDVPDLSFMCSWRDALTLPGSQPQNCRVRMQIGPFPWSPPPHSLIRGNRSRQMLRTGHPAIQKESLKRGCGSSFLGFRCLLASVLTGPGTQHEKVRQPHQKDCQLWWETICQRADPV